MICRLRGRCVGCEDELDNVDKDSVLVLDEWSWEGTGLLFVVEEDGMK